MSAVREQAASNDSIATGTPVAGAARMSVTRKYFLLLLFCMAQFMDAFNVSALFSAVPVMVHDLKLSPNESVWLISSYQLTFAAFLLVSGRISDVFNAKWAFIFGCLWLGAFSLVTGFVHNKIVLLVFRAIAGLGASLTIPSSLTLLIRLFSEPAEQARAIGVFGGSAALGNVLGLIIGAIFVQYASWAWIFWLSALIVVPIGALCIFLVPTQPGGDKAKRRLSHMDPIGISGLTAALILLVFAMTSAGTSGWGSAMVIAPLVISVVMIAAFFVYEAHIPAEVASFPPHIWFYTNFALLFGVALSIYLWFTTVFLLKVSLWQDVYGWSAINSAVHFLPIGCFAGPIMIFSANFTQRFERKLVLLVSLGLTLIGSVILPFAYSPRTYWRLDFPGLVIGAIGAALLFTNANVAVFHHTPPEIAGTVGAVFNSALQLGSAVGLAVITSVQNTLDLRETRRAGDALPTDEKIRYRGRAAAFWFLLAIVGVETLAVLLLYRRTDAHATADEEGAGEGKSDAGSDVVTPEDASATLYGGEGEKRSTSRPASSVLVPRVTESEPMPRVQRP